MTERLYVSPKSRPNDALSPKDDDVFHRYSFFGTAVMRSAV